jgi:DNA-binding response OmpR family regulator
MSSNRKLHVLLVDDESDIITIMKKGLEQYGFHVDAFSDPKQALSQFKPDYYDAIILDVRMPIMSGFEVAKEIWAVDERARICFFSAFEIYEGEAQKVFRKFKSHCFITKPITPNELVTHIQGHLVPA